MYTLSDVHTVRCTHCQMYIALYCMGAMYTLLTIYWAHCQLLGEINLFSLFPDPLGPQGPPGPDGQVIGGVSITIIYSTAYSITKRQIEQLII